jgi:hypothetical protein
MKTFKNWIEKNKSDSLTFLLMLGGVMILFTFAFIMGF